MSDPERVQLSESFEVEYLNDVKTITSEIDLVDLKNVIDVLWNAYKHDSNIFFAGNGGSAATASHMAADISKNTVIDPEDNEERRIRAISLTDNTAWHTASANDLGYENIFVDQLRNFAVEGDVLFLISGSGNSENVIKAAKWAKQKGLTSIGLLAFDGGELESLVDKHITIDTDDYGKAESVHSTIQHLVVSKLQLFKLMEVR